MKKKVLITLAITVTIISAILIITIIRNNEEGFKVELSEAYRWQTASFSSLVGGEREFFLLIGIRQ